MSWSNGEWRLSDKGKRAKFYRLTAAGRSHLRVETAVRQHYVSTVTQLLTAPVKPA